MYVASSGIAHWADPVGPALATACQGLPMSTWRRAHPGDIPADEQCRSSGCRRWWQAFAARSKPPPD